MPAGQTERTALLSRAAYSYWRTVQTRWADNDVYGHVNNTVYYQWFDLVINGWLIDRGLLDIGAGDPIGLVVETSCRYAAPLTFPEPVEVGLRLLRLGSSSVTYGLGVFAQGSDVAAAEGQFTHVYVGREGRRPVALSAGWRTVLRTLE